MNSTLIDWPKLTLQFGHQQNLHLWLNDLINSAHQELSLLQQAHYQPQLKGQLLITLKGIAGLLASPALTQSCLQLQHAHDCDYIHAVSNLERNFGLLLIEVQTYLTKHQN
jgi:hypothetical protein